MAAKHGEMYGPIFGTKQYPPEERGPWKRWQRAASKRRWRRKHEAGFREKAAMVRKALQERSRKPCPGCGKLINRDSMSCMACRSTFSGNAASTRGRVWHELNTKYKNGKNSLHESNIQRLEVELREVRV